MFCPNQMIVAVTNIYVIKLFPHWESTNYLSSYYRDSFHRNASYILNTFFLFSLILSKISVILLISIFINAVNAMRCGLKHIFCFSLSEREETHIIVSLFLLHVSVATFNVMRIVIVIIND